MGKKPQPSPLIGRFGGLEWFTGTVTCHAVAFPLWDFMKSIERQDMDTKKQRPSSLREELLPFVIRPAVTEEDFRKAVDIRHRAYARHVPEFAASLRAPEPEDYDDGSLVLLAEAKLDGSPLGTMRIQTNSGNPLKLEKSISLPSWLAGTSLAEATRLGVEQNAVGRMVRIALYKAYFLYCIETAVEWMVITARKPLDRLYEALLFQDVLPGGTLVPMHHVGNMPHRVMAFSVPDAHSNWVAAQHPLYTYVFQTAHPDIRLPEKVSPRFVPEREAYEPRSVEYLM